LGGDIPKRATIVSTPSLEVIGNCCPPEKVVFTWAILEAFADGSAYFAFDIS
jgi:hypothetical protein